MTYPFSRIVTAKAREDVGAALALIPPRLLTLVEHVPVWEGDRPFGGLWHPGWGEYQGSAYCTHWREPGGAWLSGITLPFAGWWGVGTVLHEFGHVVWNRLLRPHQRKRVFWSVGYGEVRVVPEHSGLVPAMAQFTSLEPWKRAGVPFDAFGEQFAEAFRIWLSPWERLEGLGEPGRFYCHRLARPGALDHWGERVDNRALLRWFNELAGWPSDAPPRALRSAA